MKNDITLYLRAHESPTDIDGQKKNAYHASILKLCGEDALKAAKAIAEAGSTLSLGTFDGVHTAHCALLGNTVKLRRALGASLAGAWCFSRSPAAFLREGFTGELTSPDEKAELMLDRGLDFVAMGDFPDHRDTPPLDFAINFLKDALGCVGAVSGYDFRFGRGGEGDPALLRSVFSDGNVITMPEMRLGDERISSSAIRKKLSVGDVRSAAEMLGRPYSFCAEVVDGKKLGAALGFPTANQNFPEGRVHPRHGIYAVTCTLDDGTRHIGTANVGTRPSIDDSRDTHGVNCETYLHNFSGDLYGRRMTVEFFEFLRPEMKFSSLDELGDAIRADVQATERIFSE